MEKVAYEKGHQLFKEGRLGTKIYFLEKGIVRAFLQREEKEITFWFGSEGDFIFSYNSYVAGKPGYETVELLENAILYKMEQAALHELYATDIELANWGRKLAERELVKTELCFVSQQSVPAVERYQHLMQTQPELIQRVQLSYIASFLGVTQVTLSRIRATLPPASS